ncbi:hypothetical protein MRX96_018729 [Rhipicephalus microplus]
MARWRSTTAGPDRHRPAIEGASHLNEIARRQVVKVWQGALDGGEKTGGGIRKGDTSTLQRKVGDSTVSFVAPAKPTKRSSAPKLGERQDSNEPLPEKSGVLAPNNVATAFKRPHPPATYDSAEKNGGGLKKSPAITLQGWRPFIRLRVDVPAEKHRRKVKPATGCLQQLLRMAPVVMVRSSHG